MTRRGRSRPATSPRPRRRRLLELEGLLLDRDGTLLESNELHVRAWREVLDEAGVRVPARRIRPLIGMGGDVPFGNQIPPLGMRGLYRMTGALGTPAAATVTKLAVSTGGSGFDTPNTGNRNVNDMIFPDPSNPDVLVVWMNGTTTANDGGIFRSNDGGTTWTRTSNTMSIPWYFGQIRVDPNNPERVYFLGQNLVVSDDGGKTFRSIGQNTHADHHALLIDPNDSDHLLLGNDGGFYVSEDRGASWDFALNLPISTFYAIAFDMREPYWVFGGIQDNGIDVTVQDGIPGFIRKSELSRDRSEQRPDRYAVGDKLDAKITNIDKASRRVVLSVKARELDEEKKAMADFGSSDSGASLGDILGAALNRAKKEESEEK